MDHPVVLIIELVLILSLVCISYFLYRYRQREIVFSTSQLIQSLLKLNVQYKFCNEIQKQYTRVKELPTKQKFDKYNCEELFDCVVNNEYHDFINVARKLQENCQKYEKYRYQVELLQATKEEVISQSHIPYVSFKRIENKLFKQYQLTPIIFCEIVCIATYTSPQGRNHYSKYISHSVFEVEKRYQELQQIIAHKNSVQEQKKRERAKMSDSLRYDILRRDGFRCQICGRTQEDGVKLHVDHIVPIAKGGKTVKSNLRTLCDQCNLGKRDKTE